MRTTRELGQNAQLVARKLPLCVYVCARTTKAAASPDAHMASLALALRATFAGRIELAVTHTHTHTAPPLLQVMRPQHSTRNALVE